MIFYLLILAVAIGTIIFAVSYSETDTERNDETLSDGALYPERTYRIIPNDKGKFKVEEYIYNTHGNGDVTHLWHFCNTIHMEDSLGRKRKNHVWDVTLEEAQEYVRKQQLEDAEAVAEANARQKHIADNPPKIFVPGMSPNHDWPTQEEATTLANAFPDMGINIDKINDMIKNRIKPVKPITSKRRFPGLGKSKKFRKYEE